MLSKRIRTARERAGISARELDRLAGLCQGHTSIIESGRIKSPGAGTLAAMATALAVPVTDLIENAPRVRRSRRSRRSRRGQAAA